MTMKRQKTLHRFAAVAAVLLTLCLVFMAPAAADENVVYLTSIDPETTLDPANIYIITDTLVIDERTTLNLNGASVLGYVQDDYLFEVKEGVTFTIIGGGDVVIPEISVNTDFYSLDPNSFISGTPGSIWILDDSMGPEFSEFTYNTLGIINVTGTDVTLDLQGGVYFGNTTIGATSLSSGKLINVNSCEEFTLSICDVVSMTNNPFLYAPDYGDKVLDVQESVFLTTLRPAFVTCLGSETDSTVDESTFDDVIIILEDDTTVNQNRPAIEISVGTATFTNCGIVVYVAEGDDRAAPAAAVAVSYGGTANLVSGYYGCHAESPAVGGWAAATYTTGGNIVVGSDESDPDNPQPFLYSATESAVYLYKNDNDPTVTSALTVKSGIIHGALEIGEGATGNSIFVTGGFFTDSPAAYVPESGYFTFTNPGTESFYAVFKNPENPPSVTCDEIEQDELDFAVTFTDTSTLAQLAYYYDWTADFELTLNKAVNLSTVAGDDVDGYISGQDWTQPDGDWVKHPATLEVVLENTPISIMKLVLGEDADDVIYAALLSEDGLNGEYSCGISLTEEYLKENQDLVVTLNLTLTKGDEKYVISTATYKSPYRTVTFETNGGSVIDSVVVKGTVSKPANPTKDGYTFAGWYSNAELTTAYDFSTAVTEDITLYAKWTENSVTPSGGGTDTGSGNYNEYPRQADGKAGEISFGTSKTVKAVDLPEGVTGEVKLIAKSTHPAPAGKDTHKVFEINIPNYPTGKAATIKFEMTLADIEAKGLTAADVCLYHFNKETGLWEKLPTTFKVVDGKVYFEAVTTGFSPFAIVFEKGAATPAAGADEPVTPPTETPDVPETPGTLPPVDTPETPEQPTESPAPILAVLAGLGAAVVLRRK